MDSLSTQTPGYVGPRHRADDDIMGISEVAAKWDAAGHVLIADGGTAGWDMFFPGVHFSQTIVDTFAEFINATEINCWVSRIQPGNMTPWHWDANDNEEEYRKMPNMIRCSCHVSPPTPGHALMLEEYCLYNQAQGNVWEWPDRTSWHGGINCGFTPKYLFNFFGTKK